MRRFRSKRRKPELNAQINVTNLVDVALTILIVFMVIAPLIEHSIRVQLPEAEQKRWKDAVQPVLSFLPFRAMCDVPFRLFAGDLALRELPAVLAHGLAWAAGLVLVGRWMLARAARRLVVQGG